MADIRLAKPVAGTTQTVPSAPDGRFIFDFPADAATLTRNGDDLVLSFEDGSSIRLQGFYTTYSKEEMPSFQVEGVEISGQDFFAALGEDLMPAAGPAAGSSASRGGRYNEYGGSDLLDGIDHLGRLDIGFGDGVEWADDQVGGWTHQNLDPEISGIIAVDGNDMTLVESGVETDGSQEIQGNVFTPGVPVVVGQVMASDPDGGRLSYSFADGSNRIVTEYGVITIDADTGVITYTLNNDDPDADSLALGETVRQDFTVRVEDGQGGKAEASFSVTIKGTNDQPEVTLDADSELKLTESGVGRIDSDTVVDAPGTEEENREYNGSHYDPGRNEQHLEGKVTGADVDAGHKLWFGAVAGDKSQDGGWEGAQSPDAGIFLGKDATDGDVESSAPVEGDFGHLVLNNDGSWIYTLKGEGEAVRGTASLDGETFDISSIDALPEGATITDTFTIYVKDEHGAWNLETVTITITGSNDKPSLEIRDGNGQILTDGAVLETIESDPADADDATSWPQLSGSFDIRDVDADAGSDQTILIAGGTHTDGDVEHATSPAAGHEPQPGHIGSEGGTQAIFTTDYGTLTVNPDGSWTYVVNSGSELVQQLDPEHPHFETFEITVVDEHGAYDTREIVIKVEGSSAFPVITDKDDLVFKEEGVYHDGSDGNTPTEAGDVVDGQGNVIPGHHQTESLSGRVDATDVDLGDQGNLSFRVDAADAQLKTDGTPAVTQPEAPKLVSTSPNGDTVYESGYGTLTFHADGTYTYELKSGAFDADGNAVNKLAQGEVLTETFTVTVKDTFGKEVSTDTTITIHGTNDKPRLELGDGSDGGALHVTESGVGRHDDGAVVDGPDDELVDAPSKDGTAADEIGRYDGALTDSDKARARMPTTARNSSTVWRPARPNPLMASTLPLTAAMSPSGGSTAA